jgi:hypothetical protein
MSLWAVHKQKKCDTVTCWYCNHVVPEPTRRLITPNAWAIIKAGAREGRFVHVG